MKRAVLLLATVACARDLGPAGSSNLDGLTLPLRSSPGLKVAVDGAVEGRAAEVVFDVAAPLSRVSSGCFDSSPATGDTVRVPRPDGATDALSEVEVRGLSFGGHRYARFVAGLQQGAPCVVTLGNDLLLPFALTVDIASRTVGFSRSQSREHWREAAVSAKADRAGFESSLLQLTRDPRTDWPLLAVKVTQGGSDLVGPFVLSTGEPTSQLVDDAARSAGFRTGFELLGQLELPEGVQVPPELESFKGFAFDAVELAPGVGVREGSLRPLTAAGGRPRDGVLGVLGCDLWGRFDATIDVGAGVLLLQRPRVLSSGAHQRCERGGRVDEESCFELQVERTRTSLKATGTVWRALPEGGRLHLDFSSAQGKISSPCRMGLTFSPTDRGESTQHELPWEQLEKVMPQCARALRAATRVELSMFEDGALPECPGTCAFAQDLTTGRVSCECQPQVAGVATESERQFLRIYKHMLERKGDLLPLEEEPADP